MENSQSIKMYVNCHSQGMCVLTYCLALAIFHIDVVTQPITMIRLSAQEHKLATNLFEN